MDFDLDGAPVEQNPKRVPLKGIKEVRTFTILDKEEYLKDVRNGLVSGAHGVTDEEQMLVRHVQIYNSLKNNLIDTAPAFLYQDEKFADIGRQIYALQYNPSADITAIKYIVLYLQSIYDDLGTIGDNAKIKSAGIDDSVEARKDEGQKKKEKIERNIEEVRRKVQARYQKPSQEDIAKAKKKGDEEKQKEEHDQLKKDIGADKDSPYGSGF